MPNKLLEIAEKYKDSNLSVTPSTRSQVDLNSQYDEGFLPSSNEELAIGKRRSLKQNNWDSFSNTLVRGIGKAAITIPETLGYLGDIPEMLGITDEYDNVISEWSREQKSWLDEEMPEYSRKIADEGFKPLDAEWWFRNGDSIIESLGYFVPGYGVGKAAGATLKALRTTGAVQKYGSALTAATSLNYAETMQTAGEHYRKSVDEYIKAGKTQAEARELAADEASSIVWQGKVNTLFELPAMLSLFKTFGGSRANWSTRALSGVDDSLSAGKRMGRELLTQTTSEGLEEISLGFIQSEQERNRDKNLGKEVDSESYLKRLTNYALSDKGLTEGLLGAIGGGVFGTVSAIAGKEQYKKDQELVKELTGKNTTDIRNIASDIAKFNEQERTAIKFKDELAFDIANQGKLNVLAYHNAINGTFSQFEEQLDQVADIAEQENPGIKSKLNDYKSQALYTEKVVNQVEQQYQDRSPEFRKELTSNLLNQRMYQNVLGKLNSEVNKVYTDNTLPEDVYSNLNQLYNQYTILNKSLKNANDTQKKYIETKLRETENKIKLQLPDAEDSIKEINRYSNPVVDSIIQPLEASKIKYDYELEQEKSKYNQILGNVQKAEEDIAQRTQDILREDIEEDLRTVKDNSKKAVDSNDRDSANKALQDFEDATATLRENGYTENEIDSSRKELTDNIQAIERNASKPEETVAKEEELAEGKVDETPAPIEEAQIDETPTETDDLFGDTTPPTIEETAIPQNKEVEYKYLETKPEPGLASTSNEFIVRGDELVYSAIGKPLTTGMEREFDFDYLNSPDGIKQGDIVELYVDKESKYSKEGKGNTAETLHIKIRSNGKEIGNLKNFRPTGDSLEDTKTMKVRQFLFDNPNETITTTVSEKTIGYLLKSYIRENDVLIPARNSAKSLFRGQVRLAIPSNSTNSEVVYDKVSYGRGVNGAVYAIIPSANGSLVRTQLHSRKFNRAESKAIAEFIKTKFVPIQLQPNQLEVGTKVLIDRKPYTVQKVADSIVATDKDGKVNTFSLDTTVYRNNFLYNKGELENYIFFRPGGKINLTQDRIIIDGNSTNYDDVSTEQLADIISNLYFDANKFTLDGNLPFKSLSGKEYQSYADFIVESSLYTTDLDINRPFFGSQIYLEYPKGLGEVEQTEDTKVEESQPIEEASKIVNTSTRPKGKRDIKFTYLEPKSTVDYTLKIIDALSTDKVRTLFNRFYKTDKEKFFNELIPLAGKYQVELLKELGEVSTIEELITNVRSSLSYSVEINIAKDSIRDQYNRFTPVVREINSASLVSVTGGNMGEFFVEMVNNDGNPDIRIFKTREEAEKAVEIGDTGVASSVYSTLSVPGGTNYRELEIRTPQITPAIRGHAQFSTNEGIGWFRADEKAGDRIGEKTNEKYIPNLNLMELSDEELAEYHNAGGHRAENKPSVDVYKGTKTRRILELQSDLFQKGRDRNILASSISRQQDADAAGMKVTVTDTPNENKFLQILNKDNNWVTFFINSIIQDSAKKGYEKVLFPTGNTASKIEGHETLEGFKRQKEEELASAYTRLEVIKGYTIKEDSGRYLVMSPVGYPVYTRETKEDAQWEITKAKDAALLEIDQYNNELKRVETEGFAALRPIYKFYEETVGNILKKRGYNPIRTKDEYGNEWYEVKVEEKYKDTIKLSKLAKGEGTNLSSTNNVLSYAINKSKEYNNDYSVRIGEKIQEKLKANQDLNVKIVKSEKELAKLLGEQYTNKNLMMFSPDDNTIYIPQQTIENVSEEQLAQGIIHEYIHAFTEYTILRNKWEPTTLDKSERQFIDTMSELYSHSKKFLGTEHYGMTDLSEFIAELSNPLFTNELKKIVYDNRTIWQRIIDAILRLFGITNSNKDIYSKASKSLDTFIGSIVEARSEKGENKFIRIEGFSRLEKKRRLDIINYEFIADAMELTGKGVDALETLTGKQVDEIYTAIKDRFLEDIQSDDTQKPLQKVIDRWDEFVSLSKRSMVDFGFMYNDDIESDSQLDTIEDIEEDMTSEPKESWQEQAFTRNFKDTLSKQVKLYLRFIPRIDKDGNYLVDDLGRESFVPFQEISTFLFKNLTDLTREQIPAKILELSLIRPELKKIYIDLTTNSTSENFKNSFYTNVSKTSQLFISALIENTKEGKQVSIIDANRKGLDKEIIDEWKVDYQRKMFLGDTINKDKARELLSRYNKIKLAGEVTQSQAIDISSILTDIGITMNPLGLQLKDSDIVKYLTGNGSVADILRRLSQGYDIFNLADNEVIGEKKAIGKLAELESKYRPEDTTPSMLNGEGNMVYTIQDNTAISKDISRLKTQEGIAEYLTDPFYYPSETHMNWGLKELRDNKETRDNLQIAVFDSERLNIPGMQATPYSNISPFLWTRVKVNSVLNQGNKYGWFPFPTPADKENVYFMKLPKQEVNLDRYYDMFMAETSRIYKAYRELEQWDESELIRGYHYSDKISTSDAKKDFLKGKLTGKAFDYHIFKGLNQLGYNRKAIETLSFSTAEDSEIREVIQRYFDRRVQENIDLFKELEIIEEVNGVLSNLEIDSKATRGFNSVYDIVRYYTFNVSMGYYFISSVTLGDPAFTKSYDDYIKRVALWQTPGTDIGDGQYTTVVVKDQIAYSALADSYKEALEKIGIPNSKIEDVIGKDSEYPDKRTGYYAVNRTDAQGLGSLDRWEFLLRQQGNFSTDLEQGIADLREGKTIDEALRVMSVPVKGTNVGYRMYKGKRIPVAVKYSLLPVIPAFSKYPRFAKLVRDMNTENVDEVIFESGFKLGMQGVGDVMNPKSWNKIVLNNSSYRIPQVVPYKDTGKTIFPTQVQKNIIANINWEGNYRIADDILTGMELVTEYQRLNSTNIIEDYTKTVKALKIEGDPSEYNPKIQKFLMSEIKRRNNLPDNFEDALQLIDGEFRVPLSFLLFSEKYENMLFSLFKKKVTRRKSPGMSAVNVSDFATTYDNNKQLQFYKVSYTDPVDSQEFTVEAAEVAVSQDYFRNIIKKKYPEYELSGDLVLDKIPEDLRYFIANRIPGQAKNSMVMCKIVSLLPKEAVSQIMLPKEGTVQGGYDFDIDKSYILTKNFKVVDGEIKTIEYISDPNKTKERYARYIEQYSKTEQLREILREYLEDIAYTEDVVFKMDNALEAKVNEVLSINRDTIEDEEYYELIRDYLALENMTEEEFSKLNIYEQNTREARENRVVDIFIGVLSSSHNFYESILPNNLDTLKSIRTEIAKIEKPKDESRDVLNDYQYEVTRQKNQAGKQLIGVFSNKAVARGYLQLIDHTADTPVLFNGAAYGNYGNRTDDTGVLITDNNLELQTASVDNAKEPVLGDLNVSIFTADVVSMVNDLGVNLSTNMLFIKQPILVRLNDMWNNGGRTNKAGLEAYSKLKEELVTKIRQIEPQFSPKAELKMQFTDRLIKNLRDNAEGKETYDYLTGQLDVLETFMIYKGEAQKYTDFVNSLRADSMGTLPNVVRNRLWLDKYRKNIDSDTAEKLEMMSTYSEYGIAKPLELADKLFIWNSPSFRTVYDSLSTTQTDMMNDKIAKALNYDFFSYIYMQPDSPLYGASENMNTYLYGSDVQKSLSDRIVRLQEYEKKLKGNDESYLMNPFIQALKIREYEGYKIVVMDNTSGTRTSEQKSEMSDSWYDLFLNDKTSELAWDLVQYSFLTNGFDKGAFTFMDLVPIRILEDMGVIDYYKRIEGSIRNSTLNVDYSEFIEKFIRNKRNIGLGITKRIQKRDRKYTNAVQINDNTFRVALDDFSIEVEGNKTYPLYISMNDSGKERVFRFSHGDTEYGTYEETPILGTSATKEYMPGKQLTSIFAENNKDIPIKEIDSEPPIMEQPKISNREISDEEAEQRLKDCE